MWHGSLFCMHYRGYKYQAISAGIWRITRACINYTGCQYRVILRNECIRPCLRNWRGRGRNSFQKYYSVIRQQELRKTTTDYWMFHVLARIPMWQLLETTCLVSCTVICYVRGLGISFNSVLQVTAISFTKLLLLFVVPINPLNTERRLLYLKTQFVPRSKHFISVIKTNQFML